jgi:hypothetical protein
MNFAGFTAPGGGLVLSPAKLESALLIGAGQTFMVHGNTTNQPFTFSSDGPWSANITPLGVQNLELRNGSEVLVRVARSNVTNMRLERDGNGVVAFGAFVKPDVAVTVFPGKPFEQTLRFSQAGSIAVRTDGTFAVAGSLRGEFALAGNLPVNSIQAGSTAVVERVLLNNQLVTRLVLSGGAVGGVLDSIEEQGGASATLTIASTGETSFTGSVNVPWLEFGQFKIVPSVGTAFVADYSGAGLKFRNAEARLLFVDKLLCTFPMEREAELTSPMRLVGLRENFFIPRSGDFSFKVKPATLSLMGYGFTGAEFLLGKRSGVFGIYDLKNAGINLPVLGSLNFSGFVVADGTVALTNIYGSPTAPANLLSFPVAGMTNILSTGPGRYKARVLEDNPKAYWRLGDAYTPVEGFGPKLQLYAVRDEKGLFHMAAPESVEQKVSGGILYDSNTAFGFEKSGSLGIRMKSSSTSLTYTNRESSFDFTGPFTLETWVKIPAFSSTSSYDPILTKGDSSWRLQRSGTSRKLSFGTTGLSNVDLASIRDVDDDRWHHIVAVYDGTKKYLYIDGQLEASEEVTGTLAKNNAGVLIAGNAEQPTRKFKGLMDEVAIYGNALNAQDVADHYRLGAGTLLSSTVKIGLNAVGNVVLKGDVAPSGRMNWSGEGSVAPIAGYQFELPRYDFGVRPVNGTFAANLDLQAKMSIPGIVQKPTLRGTISSSGRTTLFAENELLRLGGFTASDSRIDFDSQTGLRAAGTFGLGTFGSLSFTNTIPSNGQYALRGSGALRIGNFNVGISGDAPLLLTPTGISGNGGLDFGNFDPGVSFQTVNGVLRMTGNRQGDSGWQYFLNNLGVKILPAYRLKWNASFSASSDLSQLNANLTGVFAVWNIPLPAKPPEGENWPDGIAAGATATTLKINIPASGTFNLPQDGRIRIDRSFAGKSFFEFQLP